MMKMQLMLKSFLSSILHFYEHLNIKVIFENQISEEVP